MNGILKLVFFVCLAILQISAQKAQAQSIEFDQSVSPELKSQVQNDFAFLESITSEKTSPLHQEIFGHSAFMQGGLDIHYLERRLGLK